MELVFAVIALALYVILAKYIDVFFALLNIIIPSWLIIVVSIVIAVRVVLFVIGRQKA